MSATNSLLVTGAAGQLGRRVVELLLETKAGRVFAGTRSPEKCDDLAKRGALVRKVDFDEPETLRDALAGVDRVLLVSTDSMEPGKRGQQHDRAIGVLANAGVEHVVYTSLARAEAGSPVLLAGDHISTERALAESGLAHTILRNNLYTDLLMMSLPKAVAVGKLLAAAGTGGAAYVTREDCARAAAAALSSPFAGTRTLELTGPAVVTYAELAQLASELCGMRVAYVPMEPDAMTNAMVTQGGMPEAVAQLWVSFDVGMARGYFGPASTAFRELTGNPPTSVAEFLSAHRDALVAAAAK
ncbi:MAG: SDR family oxidoreductase [Myxococcales bacterium]|jgi:NAD(P)H dehydrogenase (quinone)|nr:SDR family oxidoreductase [Myxococcales bacterium]